jgi:uncharacterized protein YbjT (DUF2867 family)
MSNQKIIAVAGATGAQGGGLVRAILADPSGGFAVRALTRDPAAPAARALAAAGAEVVAADLADPPSVARAFAGAYGAYCVTFFWNHMSPDKEREEARALASAAQQARLKHVVWSTLEDTRRWMDIDDKRMPTLMGHYKVPHFDVKGEADAFFRDSGVPTTCLLTSFYWDNLIHFGMGPKAGPDGKLVLALPMGDRKLPGIAAEDIGRCAYGLFMRPAEFVDRTVGISGEHLTGRDMAAGLTRALGRDVTYQAMSFDAYRGLGFPGADDLGNMFQFNHDFADEFCEARSVEFSRSINPGLQNFAAWLKSNASRIPLG